VDLLLVQPNLPRAERWGDALQPLALYRVRAFADRAFAAEPRGIAALVLPENLLTTRVDASRELSASLEAWVDALGAPILTGLVMSARRTDPRIYRSAAVWLEPARGITARLDKQRAIPLLESSRRFLGDAWLAHLFGSAASWPRVEEEPRSRALAGPAAIAPLLCYEVLFPAIAARRRASESVALANLADDSWLPGAEVSRRLTQLARFRAIEQRLALVRVAHGGLSAVVDEFGRVREELPLDRYSARRVSLRALPAPAWRERLAVLALPAAAFAIVIGMPARSRRAGSTRRARPTRSRRWR
jgi:apolipoprotein N-acyltransferase